MKLPLRYVVYGLSTTCITLLYSLRLAFHSTIICQLENVTDSFLHDNDLKQYTFQSVGFGLALGLIPIHFISFLGTRKVTLIFGALGTLSAFVYPWAHELGFQASFTIRLLQGVPLVVLLWLIAKVSAEWTPKSEVAMAIAILTSVYQLAPFVAQITAAEMCQGVGWQYTYYFLATLCALAHIAFYYIYSDRVQDSSFASEEEKNLINNGKREPTKDVIKVPYSQLFTDATVWTSWFANLAFFSSLLIFLQYGPMFINQVLGYSVRITGYSGGFAHILCLLTKIIFGRVMDKSNTDITTKLKSAWAAVEIPSVVCLLCLIYINDALIKLVCIVVFIAIHGIAIVIIVKTQAFRSGEHSHVLANGNTFCVVLCLFVQPPIVKYIVQSNSFEEWSHVFGLHAIIISISIGLFVSLVDGKPAKWTGITPVKQTEL